MPHFFASDGTAVQDPTGRIRGNAVVMAPSTPSTTEHDGRWVAPNRTLTEPPQQNGARSGTLSHGERVTSERSLWLRGSVRAFHPPSHGTYDGVNEAKAQSSHTAKWAHLLQARPTQIGIKPAVSSSSLSSLAHRENRTHNPFCRFRPFSQPADARIISAGDASRAATGKTWLVYSLHLAIIQLPHPFRPFR